MQHSGFSCPCLLSFPPTVQNRKGQVYPGLSGTLFGGGFGFHRGFFQTRKSAELVRNVYSQNLRLLIFFPPVSEAAQRLVGSAGLVSVHPYVSSMEIHLGCRRSLNEVLEVVSADRPIEEAPGRWAPVWDLVSSSLSERIPVGDEMTVFGTKIRESRGSVVGFLHPILFPFFPFSFLSFPWIQWSFHSMGFVPVPEYPLYIPWFFPFLGSQLLSHSFLTPSTFLSHVLLGSPVIMNSFRLLFVNSSLCTLS